MAIGVFEMVLGVVVVGSISSYLTSKHKLERERIRARTAGLDAEQSSLVSDLHQDVAKLKERVRVLEKLVTDDDRRLSDEIERLRRSDTRTGL